MAILLAGWVVLLVVVVAGWAGLRAWRRRRQVVRSSADLARRQAFSERERLRREEVKRVRRAAATEYRQRQRNGRDR
jgi:hypothetical protein